MLEFNWISIYKTLSIFLFYHFIAYSINMMMLACVHVANQLYPVSSVCYVRTVLLAQAKCQIETTIRLKITNNFLNAM